MGTDPKEDARSAWTLTLAICAGLLLILLIMIMSFSSPSPSLEETLSTLGTALPQDTMSPRSTTPSRETPVTGGSSVGSFPDPTGQREIVVNGIKYVKAAGHVERGRTLYYYDKSYAADRIERGPSGTMLGYTESADAIVVQYPDGGTDTVSRDVLLWESIWWTRE